MSTSEQARDRAIARAVLMLRVARKVISEANGHDEVFYDGVMCDEVCIRDDIQAAEEELANFAAAELLAELGYKAGDDFGVPPPEPERYEATF